MLLVTKIIVQCLSPVAFPWFQSYSFSLGFNVYRQFSLSEQPRNGSIALKLWITFCLPEYHQPLNSLKSLQSLAEAQDSPSYRGFPHPRY